MNLLEHIRWRLGDRRRLYQALCDQHHAMDKLHGWIISRRLTLPKWLNERIETAYDLVDEVLWGPRPKS